MKLGALMLLFGLATSFAAHGDWGTGEWGANNCPQTYAPAPGAMDGSDEVANLKGKLDEITEDLQTLRERRDGIDDKIKRTHEAMGRVLTDDAISAVTEHWEHKSDARSYRPTCGGREGKGGDDSDTDIEFPDAGKDDHKVNHNDIPPPGAFCIRDPKTGKIKNTWRAFAANDGYVHKTICNYLLPGVSTSRDGGDRRDCREGLHDFYELQEKKAEINRRIAKLKRLKSKARHRLDKVLDDIEEGTYCAYCDDDENSSTTGAMTALAAVLMASQRQQQPPAIAPYGYPQNAYPGRLPGYMNVGPNNYYGTAPGGIGPGAFNCPNNRMGTPQYNGQPNMLENYGLQSNGYTPLSDMLLGGAGPGWAFPEYGNDPGAGPFNGQFAGPGASQYSQGNGLGYNYDPYYGYQRGYNPNWMNNVYDGRYGGFQYDPQLGSWNGFGYGNGNAPNILPYMGPGYGPGMNGWNGAGGAQYFGNQYNFWNSGGTNWNGGGWNSGGNFHGPAPAILPYIGPGIYNAPGTNP